MNIIILSSEFASYFFKVWSNTGRTSIKKKNHYALMCYKITNMVITACICGAGKVYYVCEIVEILTPCCSDSNL